MSISREEIESKVFDHVAYILKIDVDQIDIDSLLIEDLGGDSLDLVEVVMGLEEVFDGEIPDEEAEKITSVREIIDYVEEHLNN